MSGEFSPVLRNGLRQTPFAEAYRALRANLNFSATSQGVRSVLVTSGRAAEGKTTILANLGILLAEADRRVILVDADFRHPSLTHLLDTQSNRPKGPGNFWQEELPTPLGLAEMITGDASFAEAALPVRGVENLLLVPTGALPPNPGELLATPVLRDLMQELCEHADMVLVDTPPCTLYSDALELTQVTDGVLYVIRSGPQPPDHPRSLRQLQQGKARLLGLVINEIDGSMRHYEHHGARAKTAHA
jgi:capsular exopolysaccharide synthesis family protein